MMADFSEWAVRVGVRLCCESTSSMVERTSKDWVEVWREGVGRVMVRTLALGASFSSRDVMVMVVEYSRVLNDPVLKVRYRVVEKLVGKALAYVTVLMWSFRSIECKQIRRQFTPRR